MSYGRNDSSFTVVEGQLTYEVYESIFSSFLSINPVVSRNTPVGTFTSPSNILSLVSLTCVEIKDFGCVYLIDLPRDLYEERAGHHDAVVTSGSVG